MNERIDKLIEQCTVQNFSDCVGGYETFDKEKFAELIVRECLGDLKERIALRYQLGDKDRDIGYGMEIVYWDIVDKFGVE
jgi:hypothetical protein